MRVCIWQSWPATKNARVVDLYQDAAWIDPATQQVTIELVTIGIARSRSALQCSAMQCSAVQCSSLPRIALPCLVLPCIALAFALHYILLYYTPFHFILFYDPIPIHSNPTHSNPFQSNPFRSIPPRALAQVKIKMITVNNELDVLALLTFTLDFDRGGGVSASYVVSSTVLKVELLSETMCRHTAHLGAPPP